MNSFRTLRIYGTKDPNTDYTVFVNGTEVDVGLDELYSFVTGTEFHGSYNVKICVTNGSLTLTHVTATYPAIINGIEGLATMIQPIKYPIAIFENNCMKQLEFPIKIDASEILDYEHLMLNGPTLWKIDIKDPVVKQGVNIFVGNLLTDEITNGITDIKYDYRYDKKPNDINSTVDLENLKLGILATRSNNGS